MGLSRLWDSGLIAYGCEGGLKERFEYSIEIFVGLR